MMTMMIRAAAVTVLAAVVTAAAGAVMIPLRFRRLLSGGMPGLSIYRMPQVRSRKLETYARCCRRLATRQTAWSVGLRRRRGRRCHRRRGLPQLQGRRVLGCLWNAIISRPVGI